ncbi:MAG TPA: penicillin-binding transpeptidase domain-containing protein [Fibrobacteraceae bacterium]|nr:penicillin-binding transpeptidase domain-containing protein [Fibrobacteraceae bacterium]
MFLPVELALAPFTLFDFQPRRRRPRRPLPKGVRLLNRFLLLLAFTAFPVGLARGLFFHPSSEDSAPDTTVVEIQSSHPTESEAPSIAATPEAQQSTEDEGLDGDSSPIVEESTPQSETTPSVERKCGLFQKDSLLGAKIDQILHQYRPYGAFYLMVDAQSNEILAWGQRSDSAIQQLPSWLSRSTFPAASLIKMVTSVAAMESGHYGTATSIPLIGSSTTLYSRQLRTPENYQGPTITLEEAFARSCNPAMALVGIHLGGKRLRYYGMRLGFDRLWPNGTPQPSRYLPPDTGFALAEVASGFTQANTISPLHAAAIVRALSEQEPLQMPWSHDIPQQYAPREGLPLGNSEFSPDTYYGMRQLFLRTVSDGTAHKWMRRTLSTANRDALWIGGKTGSLNGSNPSGRYDWFAGFAQSRHAPHRGVVLVVMQLHDAYRTLPSSAVAGLLINAWAREYLGQNLGRQ